MTLLTVIARKALGSKYAVEMINAGYHKNLYAALDLLETEEGEITPLVDKCRRDWMQLETIVLNPTEETAQKESNDP